MSQCYHIACIDCRETLWIAQAGIGGKSFYSGEARTMVLLKEFLFRHEGHHLVFRPDEHFDDFKNADPEWDEDPVD